MNVTLNRPIIQVALVAWGTFCLFGVLLGVKLALFDYSFGTDAWQASILLIALSLFSWLAVAVIVWSQQRELTFGSEAIRIRRWTDVLLGRPGRHISLVGAPRVRIFVGSYGYSAVKIEVSGKAISFPLTFWPRQEARRLPEILEDHGFTVEIGGSVLDG